MTKITCFGHPRLPGHPKVTGHTLWTDGFSRRLSELRPLLVDVKIVRSSVWKKAPSSWQVYICKSCLYARRCKDAYLVVLARVFTSLSRGAIVMKPCSLQCASDRRHFLMSCIQCWTLSGASVSIPKYGVWYSIIYDINVKLSCCTLHVIQKPRECSNDTHTQKSQLVCGSKWAKEEFLKFINDGHLQSNLLRCHFC